MPHFLKQSIKKLKKIKNNTSIKHTSRKDYRAITTFTIDPVDAKDFDDAFSIEKLPNGHFSIGVHIADVSHYVKPKTALDQEAFKRGTSVYMIDKNYSNASSISF